MTDYTDLIARLREPIIGDAHGDGLITSGRLAERLIRERGEAAAAIAALTAERDALDAVTIIRNTPETELIGLVMKLTGGSAHPNVVKAQIAAALHANATQG